MYFGVFCVYRELSWRTLVHVYSYAVFLQTLCVGVGVCVGVCVGVGVCASVLKMSTLHLGESH